MTAMAAITQIRDNILGALRTQLSAIRGRSGSRLCEADILTVDQERDIANNIAQGMMELAELVEAATAWASATKAADALIERSAELGRLRRTFEERAEPFGPSLAQREADKIGHELAALEVEIRAACAHSLACKEQLHETARRIAMPDPDSVTTTEKGQRS